MVYWPAGRWRAPEGRGTKAYDYIKTGVDLVLDHPEYYHKYRLWLYDRASSPPGPPGTRCRTNTGPNAPAPGRCPRRGSITQKSSDYMKIGGKSVRYQAASSVINNVGLPYVFDEQVTVSWPRQTPPPFAR